MSISEGIASSHFLRKPQKLSLPNLEKSYDNAVTSSNDTRLKESQQIVAPGRHEDVFH